MDTERREVVVISPQIGLWDAVSIIIGIIIGVGIFRVPVDVLQQVSGPWQALGVWALGGVLALVGALCFAELAAAYPRSGGEYVYLTRAYGMRVGFLYAWAQLTVIRPAGIAAVAYIFADHANHFLGLGAQGVCLLAAGAVALITIINILGVVLGTTTQNVLTLAKVIALAAIGIVGFLWAHPHVEPVTAPVGEGSFAVAMIFIFWAYSGWHEAAYVAAEVKDSRRNLPLALIFGTAAVTLVYLVVNGAILAGLGFEAARQSETFARDLLKAVLGTSAGKVYDIVVIISALGAINGMVFTTARIYAAFGEDHRLLWPLAHWSRRWRTPVRALAVQGILSVAYDVGVGFLWQQQNGFNALVEFTAAVFWLFFLATGIALFVLRKKDADLPRPFRVPAYPLLPILFCAVCAYMIGGSVMDMPTQSLIGLGILLVGLPFSLLTGPPRRRRRLAVPPAVQPERSHTVA